jgi:carboxypeptidase Taq
MRRIHTHATAVPADLVEARSKAVSRCEIAWRGARADSDFPRLLPLLSEVLICERQVAQAKGDALGLSPYDALLDSHDPGARQADIDPLFAALKADLPQLLGEALEQQRRRPPPPPMEGPFPIETQRGIGQRLMAVVGFDPQRGRLDVSTHPFCGGAINDVRITARYDEADFSSSLMGVLHESGHALYEQGRPRQWLGQPVGVARGMSMHESQSLLVEMQVCRSRAFAEYLAPLVREAFGAGGAAWDTDALLRHFTRVRPGFIRVDADEITYPSHIIVRYELEKALIGGEMALGDLPSAFNAGIRDMLGLNVPEDRLGCLQDIHWPGGAWGYFPSYTLGAMIAAQLFEAACQAEPDVLPGIGRGDFAPLLGWLRANVHELGSSAPTGEILARATGRPLDAAVYRRHLANRYLNAA